MNNFTRPQKITDLHTAEDATADKGYIELYFSCCFYELFPFENERWTSRLDGSEMKEILSLLNITVFDRYLLQKFNDQKNTNAEVFHSVKDARVFAYFDFYKDPEDKYDNFFLGLCFNASDDSIIMAKVLSMYQKLQHCSPLTYDLTHKMLYNKVFRSNVYFYKNNYNPYGRLLQHHGLKQGK